MRGRNSWMSSSWKLDSSQTIQHAPVVELSQRAADVARHGRAEHLAEERGRGRLPIRPGHSEDRRGEHRPPSSISLQTGMLRSKAALTRVPRTAPPGS